MHVNLLFVVRAIKQWGHPPCVPQLNLCKSGVAWAQAQHQTKVTRAMAPCKESIKMAYIERVMFVYNLVMY